MCINPNINKEEISKHVVNMPYDPDYILPSVCLISGENVDFRDYSLLTLNTTEGKKLFKLWVSGKYQVLKRTDLIELIQDTIGNPININNLKC